MVFNKSILLFAFAADTIFAGNWRKSKKTQNEVNTDENSKLQNQIAEDYVKKSFAEEDTKEYLQNRLYQVSEEKMNVNQSELQIQELKDALVEKENEIIKTKDQFKMEKLRIESNLFGKFEKTIDELEGEKIGLAKIVRKLTQENDKFQIYRKHFNDVAARLSELSDKTQNEEKINLQEEISELSKFAGQKMDKEYINLQGKLTEEHLERLYQTDEYLERLYQVSDEREQLRDYTEYAEGTKLFKEAIANKIKYDLANKDKITISPRNSDLSTYASSNDSIHSNDSLNVQYLTDEEMNKIDITQFM